MNYSRRKILEEILKDLHKTTTDIDASAIFSTDGLILASEIPKDVEKYRVAAMAAATLSVGGRISQELKKGTLEQILIKGSNGYIMMVGVGDEILLTAFTKKNEKINAISPSMEKTAKKLSEVVYSESFGI